MAKEDNNDEDITYITRRSMSIVFKCDASYTALQLASHFAKVLEDSADISVIRVNMGGIVFGNPKPKELPPGKYVATSNWNRDNDK